MGVSDSPLLASQRKWKQHGQSGIPVSNWLPHIAECVDDMAVIRSCWANGLKYEEEQTAFGPGACNTFYPAGTTPRMAAGGPLADDIAKCQLKPLNAADYGVSFTPEQWARLSAIFPEVVCDWTKPGVGQQPLAGTWLSFGPSPVNLLFDITGLITASVLQQQ